MRSLSMKKLGVHINLIRNFMLFFEHWKLQMGCKFFKFFTCGTGGWKNREWASKICLQLSNLDGTKRSVASWSREGILPLHCVLLRSILVSHPVLRSLYLSASVVWSSRGPDILCFFNKTHFQCVQCCCVYAMFWKWNESLSASQIESSTCTIGTISVDTGMCVNH